MDNNADGIGNSAKVAIKQFGKAVILQVLKEDLKKEEVARPTAREVEQILEVKPGDVDRRKANKVAHQMMLIADLVDGQVEEQGIMDSVRTRDDFRTLAYQFIQIGGVTSWGGIAVFVCVSCKFAIKTLLDTMKGLPVFGSVIQWILDFINENLVPWIDEAGGWASVLDRSTPRDSFNTGVLTGMTVGSIVTGLAIFAFFKLRRH